MDSPGWVGIVLGTARVGNEDDELEGVVGDPVNIVTLLVPTAVGAREEVGKFVSPNLDGRVVGLKVG